MSTDLFLQRCQQLAAKAGPGGSAAGPTPELSDADSLIGFFQTLRPDGGDLASVFNTLPQGADLVDRLERVYQLAGDQQRPGGGKDAFFIVRTPDQLTVEAAEHHADQWIDGLRQIAEVVGDETTANALQVRPKIRVLEGIPPKHPKLPEHRSDLLSVFLERCEELCGKVENVDPHADLMRPAYYFIACDAMLRDYLMWPFYAQQTTLTDPLRSYFTLWAHGVKYRIFREDQVDLYLPREAAV
ncbi:apolipoprotein acyltransferase [Roseiconus nitratireducens]|uniref:Apolipoprotein acyltransferase n=1 Tax=Roseiconus nitratireducens TaxID=2605748 RepID=A0A5M6D3A4_9BACT|nr:apolipoprotein acyltransferase [Roseiconus nitratireducens]KAA5541376.1 apolipoprotein acyltransferase [Roseiconus nitratireducens]